MSKLIFLLLIFIPNFLIGQPTKKVTDKDSHETYFVLKSDKTTRHGEYKKFNYNNRLLVKGYYKLGVKDSIWESFDFDGNLSVKYDYTNNKLITHNPGDFAEGREFRILNESDSDTILSRIPIFLYGDYYIFSVIIENLHYPASARENGIMGKVYVLFTIDKAGKASNFHVNTPLGYGMDEESIRVLKLIPDNWLPGLLNDRPVDVEVSFPINFTLK